MASEASIEEGFVVDLGIICSEECHVFAAPAEASYSDGKFSPFVLSEEFEKFLHSWITCSDAIHYVPRDERVKKPWEICSGIVSYSCSTRNPYILEHQLPGVSITLIVSNIQAGAEKPKNPSDLC